MSAYLEKLKDPRWQKKRLEVMNRSAFKCECCGDDKETLQVHHLIYIKGQEPWDAPIENLECLCRTCHEWRESFNSFFGGRSIHPSAFCVHVFERLQPSFSGELPFKQYPFFLAMAKDVTQMAIKADDKAESDTINQ